MDLFNEIRKYLYKYGYYTEALFCFEKALDMDQSHVKVEKNSNEAESFLFPGPMFRSLNDKTRNDAYRTAIKSSINPGNDSVINIDAATGLLTACESSNVLIYII